MCGADMPCSPLTAESAYSLVTMGTTSKQPAQCGEAQDRKPPDLLWLRGFHLEFSKGLFAPTREGYR